MLKDLTASHIRNIFSYNPDDGFLRWRNAAGSGSKIPAGTIAGQNHPEGYRYVRVGKKMYRVSRLIWLYVTGQWPKHQIDHIDRNPANDKWKNLREASGSQNKANSRKYRNKSCNLKGVQAVQKRHSIRYRAVITKDGNRINLGNFDTPELAHEAYMKAAKKLHGEFASSGTERTNG